MTTGETVTVVLVGAGNIGSQLGPLLARINGISRIVIVDPDYYDETNLHGQNILARHVGMAKTAVLCKIMQTINPGLRVSCEAVEVQSIPLGVFRADLIVCCVDNRLARQAINQRARRMGVPWLDTAVDANHGLARINLYMPGDGQPCLECAWTDEEYALLEVRHTCSGEKITRPATTATAAPAELGAFVASVACLQIRKVLAGDLSLAGQQLMFDTQFHRQFVAKLPFNEHCLFDHATWTIKRLLQPPEAISLGQALSQISGSHTEDTLRDVKLRSEGQTFVSQLTCVECSRTSNRFLRLSDRLRPWQRRCHSCGGRREASGFDQVPELCTEGVSAGWLEKPLSALGFCEADVFSLTLDRQVEHFQLGVADG